MKVFVFQNGSAVDLDKILAVGTQYSEYRNQTFYQLFKVTLSGGEFIYESTLGCSRVEEERHDLIEAWRGS